MCHSGSDTDSGAGCACMGTEGTGNPLSFPLNFTVNIKLPKN